MVVNSIYIDSLTEFLLERYELATFSEKDYSVLYINALTTNKATMIIGEQIYSSSLIYVVYLPYTYSSSRAVANTDNEKIKQQAYRLLEKLNLK